MILTRYNECPDKKDTNVSSPYCMSCRCFIKRRWYTTYGMYGIFCKKAIEKAEEYRLTSNDGQDVE